MTEERKREGCVVAPVASGGESMTDLERTIRTTAALTGKSIVEVVQVLEPHGIPRGAYVVARPDGLIASFLFFSIDRHEVRNTAFLFARGGGRYAISR